MMSNIATTGGYIAPARMLNTVVQPGIDAAKKAVYKTLYNTIADTGLSRLYASPQSSSSLVAAFKFEEPLKKIPEDNPAHSSCVAPGTDNIVITVTDINTTK
eukprot:CAMPEP_0167763064 /NCGR_PEP_ID=MMETSP0110_2-20121227/13137_1 /TAXON_ID=629695 /ORGANISM="Gymnochlora sp., Strain CCMP2014" /LENGTH=101 /DNA_ID=CAMNT_0007650051 /DNA_START=481 /DNA_END=783 /DNA_ORIENTATION=+